MIYKGKVVVTSRDVMAGLRVEEENLRGSCSPPVRGYLDDLINIIEQYVDPKDVRAYWHHKHQVLGDKAKESREEAAKIEAAEARVDPQAGKAHVGVYVPSPGTKIRRQQVVKAIAEFEATDGDEDKRCADGRPQVKAVEEILGYDITAEERDTGWSTYCEITNPSPEAAAPITGANVSAKAGLA